MGRLAVAPRTSILGSRDLGGGGCASSWTWAGTQMEGGARVKEAVVPETDAKAVRITTVHAAKGWRARRPTGSSCLSTPASWSGSPVGTCGSWC